MKINHPASCILVAGQQGCGKSTLALRLLAEKKAARKFIYDPEGEFIRRNPRARVLGSFEELDNAGPAGGELVFMPGDEWIEHGYGDKDQVGCFQVFSKYCLEAAEVYPGNKVFFSDELDQYVDSHNYPKWLVAAIQIGRKRQLDCLFVSGAIASLHNRVRDKVTEAYIFQHVDDTAINWVKKVGFDPEEIRNLKKWEWVYRNLRTGEMRRSK